MTFGNALIIRPDGVLQQAPPRNLLERQLRAGTVERLARGIYCQTGSGASTYISLLRALTTDAAHIVSYDTAASLWGFRDAAEPPFHLTALPGHNRFQRPGLIISHLQQVPAEHIFRRNGASPSLMLIPLLSARTLA